MRICPNNICRTSEIFERVCNNGLQKQSSIAEEPAKHTKKIVTLPTTKTLNETENERFSNFFQAKSEQELQSVALLAGDLGGLALCVQKMKHFGP